jgi:hypothetical protein
MREVSDNFSFYQKMLWTAPRVCNSVAKKNSFDFEGLNFKLEINLQKSTPVELSLPHTA